MGDFSNLLTPIDRSSRQKIEKETQPLNDTLDKLYLTDIYRAFHLEAIEFTFFLSAHGTFSMIEHILGHKSSFGKFLKAENISNIFSDHKAVRYQLQENKKPIKKHKHMEAKQYASE